MDNLKLPAYPLDGQLKQNPIECRGFSKLEFASFMIAQGMICKNGHSHTDETIAVLAVQTAKAILEEANK